MFAAAVYNLIDMDEKAVMSFETRSVEMWLLGQSPFKEESTAAAMQLHSSLDFASKGLFPLQG